MPGDKNQTSAAQATDAGDVQMLRPGQRIRVRYKNCRGEIAIRNIALEGVPIWTRSEWHPEPQWLIWGSDIDAGWISLFWAVKDMEPA